MKRNTKLNEIKYYPEFYTFLRKRRLIRIYERSFEYNASLSINSCGGNNNGSKYKTLYDFLSTVIPNIWISDAFWWNDTKMEFRMWHNIHQAWEKQLNKIKNDEKNRIKE